VGLGAEAGDGGADRSPARVRARRAERPHNTGRDHPPHDSLMTPYVERRKSLPRPELPNWVVKLSTAAAMPVIFVTTIVYVDRLITKPIAEVASLSLSGIGIAATLAALCNGLARGVQEEAAASTFTYTAEKFLHACVLLIQTLFLIFVRDALVEVEWISRYPILWRFLITTVCNVVAGFLSAYACYAWYWGFSALNTALWSRWHERIKAINAARSQPVIREGSTGSDDGQGIPSTANKVVP